MSACQQAAWKAGASADDLKRDEQTCGAPAVDDAVIKQCLRRKGWTVTEAAPVENEGVALTTGAITGSTLSANTAPATAISSSTNAPVTSTPATQHTPPDPLQQQSIQTWWKAGAQAADFDADANVCLKQLGAQHTPNYAQHLYTNAMINCLREHGWSAGRDPVYTPLR